MIGGYAYEMLGHFEGKETALDKWERAFLLNAISRSLPTLSIDNERITKKS